MHSPFSRCEISTTHRPKVYTFDYPLPPFLIVQNGPTSLKHHSRTVRPKMVLFYSLFLLTNFLTLLEITLASTLAEQENYRQCCIKKGMQEEVANKVCIFPPVRVKLLTPKEKFEVSSFINEFIECATEGEDHRACCKAKGVTGKWEKCQIFCNGSPSHPHYEANLEFLICERPRIARLINKCNRNL